MPAEEKGRFNLRIVGLDFDEDELRAAPAGCYDAVTVADLTSYQGDGQADLVICKSTLEHVRDGGAALHGIASLLKPGGHALLFLPCRHAAFAQLNRLLPERVKRSLLFVTFPEKSEKGGFLAYYDQASIGEYHKLAIHAGLIVKEDRAYFVSSYFSFFFPFWVMWRLYSLLHLSMRGRNAGENFMVLRKPSAQAGKVREPA